MNVVHAVGDQILGVFTDYREAKKLADAKGKKVCSLVTNGSDGNGKKYWKVSFYGDSVSVARSYHKVDTGALDIGIFAVDEVEALTLAKKALNK